MKCTIPHSIITWWNGEKVNKLQAFRRLMIRRLLIMEPIDHLLLYMTI